MGLDVTYNAWKGSYGSFRCWREQLAEVAGVPPLSTMEGFVREGGGIPWESLKPDPIHILLNHYDHAGEIAAEDCGPLADRLEELLPLLRDTEEDWHHTNAKQFIEGARAAAAANEPLIFQ
jgi:hypothetical protein